MGVTYTFSLRKTWPSQNPPEFRPHSDVDTSPVMYLEAKVSGNKDEEVMASLCVSCWVQDELEHLLCCQHHAGACCLRFCCCGLAPLGENVGCCLGHSQGVTEPNVPYRVDLLKIVAVSIEVA